MRKQLLDYAFSNKITILSLFLSISIVCVHLNPTLDFETISNNGGFFDVIFNYLNDLLTSLGSLAVSFFFLSSAYLLYRKYSFQHFPENPKRRILTLFVPLLLWNILCLLYKLRFGDGFLETLKNIVLSNYDGPLWFVVQILVLFLLSPLFLWVFRNKWVGGALTVILYFLPQLFDTFLARHIAENEQQLAVLSRTIYYLPIYFTGTYLAIHFDDFVQEERYRKNFPVVFSVLVFVLTLLPSDHPVVQFLMQIQILALWILLSKKIFQKQPFWGFQISFFIYASYAIVNGVVMRYLHKLNFLAAKQRGIFDSGKEKVNALTPPQAAGNARPEFILDETVVVSIGTALACRLLFLALSISCIYLAAWMLIRWLPKTYGILTGGRVPDLHR